MAAQEDFAYIRQYFVDPIQHDYEVIRPIVLFAETAAARSRQTGGARTGGAPQRRAVASQAWTDSAIGGRRRGDRRRPAIPTPLRGISSTSNSSILPSIYVK